MDEGQELVEVKIGDRTWKFPVKTRPPSIGIDSSLEIISWPTPGDKATCRLYIRHVGGDLDQAALTILYGNIKLTEATLAQGESTSVELKLDAGTHKFTLIEARTGAKKTITHKIQQTKPTINVDINMPKEVYPGDTAAGIIAVTYQDGPYIGLNLAVHIDGEEVWSGLLNLGNTTRVNIRLGPGPHNLIIREETLGTLYHDKINIARAPPKATLSIEQNRIRYPGGGEARIAVNLTPATAKLVGVKAKSNLSQTRVEAGILHEEGKSYIILKAGRLPPTPKLATTLELDIISPDGGHDALEIPLEVPVSLDEEAASQWEKEVSKLLEDESKANIPELLKRAHIMLDKCKAELAPFGIDCRIIEEVITSTQAEVREIETTLERIRDMLRDGALKEATSTLADIVGKCMTDRYKGLEPCSKAQEATRRLLEKLAEKSEEEASQARYENLLVLTQAGLQLCSLNIPGTGASCGVIERLHTEAREIHDLLEEMIQVFLPENNATRLIKGYIRIQYNGSNRYQGVSIDFTPASGFIRVNPQPKVELPPIYPGADFNMEIVMESLVKGRIPIPYKVCYRDYCLEKLIHTNVGTPGPITGITPSIDTYRGRSVRNLREMRLSPPEIRPLGREILIANYTCRGILGEGGFAIALLCNDPQGVNAVIKIPRELYLLLLETQEEAILEEHLAKLEKELKAFDREARILKMLNHPNIIELKEYSIEPVPYLAFEFCEYGDLDRLISRAGKLDPDTALSIMIPIADALAHGHSPPRKILHLDVKPSNILITRAFIPKLTDYNIAKVIGTVSQSSRSKPGYTPGFSPPEQFVAGMPKPGPYSDIFAHAATLYYILTGRHPYPISEWTINLFRDPPKPKPVNILNNKAPPELAMILDQALRPQPYERYQNTREYVEALIEAHTRI